MTPEEFQNNIDKAIENTMVGMIPVMKEAALSGKALLSLRIQNQGLNKQYSINKLPIFFFRGRGLQSGATERFLDKKVKAGEGVSYKEWRSANGLPTDSVKLTFTGKMFQGWNIPFVERKGLIVKGAVAGNNPEVKNKLKWNKSRFPDFDKPDDKEKKMLKDFIKPRLKELLQENLFKR